MIPSAITRPLLYCHLKQSYSTLAKQIKTKSNGHFATVIFYRSTPRTFCKHENLLSTILEKNLYTRKNPKKLYLF